LLLTQVITAHKAANQIVVLECVDDSSRFAIEASAFVDATGDANLTSLVEGPNAFGDNDGAIQVGTLALHN